MRQLLGGAATLVLVTWLGCGTSVNTGSTAQGTGGAGPGATGSGGMGLATGTGGTSTSSGGGWMPGENGSPVGLRGIWGSAASDVYVVGDQVYHSADGHTWKPQGSPGGSALWGSSSTDV